MKCPECGYVTFDHLGTCPQCQASFRLVRRLTRARPATPSPEPAPSDADIDEEAGNLRERIRDAGRARRRTLDLQRGASAGPAPPDWYQPGLSTETSRPDRDAPLPDLTAVPDGEEVKVSPDDYSDGDWREQLRERIREIRSREEGEGRRPTDEADEAPDDAEEVVEAPREEAAEAAEEAAEEEIAVEETEPEEEVAVEETEPEEIVVEEPGPPGGDRVAESGREDDEGWPYDDDGADEDRDEEFVDEEEWDDEEWDDEERDEEEPEDEGPDDEETDEEEPSLAGAGGERSPETGEEFDFDISHPPAPGKARELEELESRTEAGDEDAEPFEDDEVTEDEAAPAAEEEREAGLLWDFDAPTSPETILTAQAEGRDAVAPMGERVAAALGDTLVLLAVAEGLLAVGARMAGTTQAALLVSSPLILLATWSIFAILYAVSLTGTCGQTFGKMAMQIRVIGAARFQVTYRQAFWRAIAYVLALLPAGLGLLLALRDPAGRGLHDRLSSTRVVKA